MKKLKRTTLLLAISLSALLCATACSPQPDGKPWLVKERCIKGVTYYVGGYQLAPAFKPDGSIYTCAT